ncbi:MAG TPA: SusD/RagB family nutrient-binding outer membrane lipoprotein [Chitinophagaceae bacterium]|nr:SusD/RagB family nutrient-binding outer membrane lipoprotein [Chitinophagaceae bacterium]
MKIINKFLIISVIASLVITSCKKTEDYYIYPNSPSSLTMAALLSSVEVGTMNSLEGDLARTSSILIQQNTGVQSQSQAAQTYGLIEDQFNNHWGQIYQNLENANQLFEMAGSNNPYYAGISQIMSVLNWGAATDLWGDIPYSEALQIKKDILQPKFDSQELILAGMISTLDDAIANLNMNVSANSLVPGSDDIMFNGNISSWIKIAYTLKARYLNRYSNKGNYNPSAILNALASGITSNNDNLYCVHGGGNAQNQWYAFENNRGYIVSSASFVDSLKLRPTDLRLQYYFSQNVNGDYIGSPVEDYNDEDTISRFGVYLAGSEATPYPLVTYAEAKFIEAEAKVRMGDATAYASLNEAMKASCLEVTAGAYDGFDIALYADSSTNLSRVMYEKWLSMYGQIEAYNDYRRTGYPELTPNPGGVTNVIPKRFPIPQSERVNNPNAQSPAITTPVWWGL